MFARGNDDTKVNVELQVRMQKHWVKRELFYLARMYEEDLRAGQDYGRLKRCISIGILDFRLLEGESYHSIYLLRDEKGVELTRLWEIHIIELGKELHGDRMDGWIRLFNAESMEELDMLAAKNKGLAEAVLQLLSELGVLPDALKERIQKETDLQVLGKWLKAAARAESILNFEEKMDSCESHHHSFPLR